MCIRDSNDINPQTAEAAASAIIADGGDAMAASFDVSQTEAALSAIKDLQAQTGGIDILINNAGIFHEEQFEELDPNIWLDEMKINALSPISLTHKLMENLQAGSTKKVIFLSSQMGSIDDNYSGGYYFYRSSKAALNASAMSLSIDWKDENIAVLMMHPGWVRTDMGTSKAKLSIEESVTGMLNVIENFTIEQTGAFLNYAGQKLEW